MADPRWTIRFIGAIATGMLLLGGGTRLEVHKVSSGSAGARSGYAYMLDYTQYEIVLTRTLVSCKPGEVPKIKIEATPTASLAPDGEQVYVIDPQSLISAFKTSDINVEYKDGRLIGFNTTTEDKTGEVIASVAKTAGKIATLAAGLPMPVSSNRTGASPCTTEAENKLAFVRDNKNQLTELTAAVQKVSAELVLMTNQFAVKPSDGLRQQIIDKKEAVEAAQKANDDLSKALAAANDWLKDTVTVTWPETSTVGSSGIVHALRPTVREKWFDIYRPYDARYAPDIALDGGLDIDDPATGGAVRLSMTRAQFDREYPELVKPGFDPKSCTGSSTIACTQYKRLNREIALRRLDSVDKRNIADTNIAIEAAVSFHLVRRGSYGLDLPVAGAPAPAAALASAPDGQEKPRPKSKTPRPERDGIRYRVPAAGYLVICERDKDCVKGGEKPISRTASAIAQLGNVFNIPFSSPLFASGSISVSFDEQGRLAKAGLKRSNSVALDAARAGGSVTDEVGAYLKALDGKELAELNQEVALAKARKELFEAEQAVNKNPTELATEELALLEAQQKLATARAALPYGQAKDDLTQQIAITRLEIDLAELRKKQEDDPQADLETVRSRYNAETAVLLARKAALEAEAAAIEAQRELDKVRAGT